MKFHQKNFEERSNFMGNTAEEKFIQYCNLHGFKYAHFGFDQPDLDRFPYLPTLIKCTPDFILEGNDFHRFIEVKGFGYDRLIKLKEDNLRALKWWSKIMMVDLFFYDVIGHCCTRIPSTQIKTTNRQYQTYSDNNKRYYLFNPDEFKGWIKLY